MNMDKRQIFLLAITIGVAIGAMFASRSRRRRVAQDRQHGLNLRAWENEGGNLAPAAASPATS
jgi:hypothetical protein